MDLGINTRDDLAHQADDRRFIVAGRCQLHLFLRRQLVVVRLVLHPFFDDLVD